MGGEVCGGMGAAAGGAAGPKPLQLAEVEDVGGVVFSFLPLQGALTCRRVCRAADSVCVRLLRRGPDAQLPLLFAAVASQLLDCPGVAGICTPAFVAAALPVGPCAVKGWWVIHGAGEAAQFGAQVAAWASDLDAPAADPAAARRELAVLCAALGLLSTPEAPASVLLHTQEEPRISDRLVLLLPAPSPG
eukprot:TRINITY_DN29650_c0_g1_i1.p2 TRINITY_DN29650_c0_g1~~TRINITY_DN29650_c0_g1_i1.p2  ORF type:complete len:213 (+),score=46.15 TRINITY_DN29650_c0_g1_i1:70-639(+)